MGLKAGFKTGLFTLQARCLEKYPKQDCRRAHQRCNGGYFPRVVNSAENAGYERTGHADEHGQPYKGVEGIVSAWVEQYEQKQSGEGYHKHDQCRHADPP
jgi:hypothetical protein